MTIIWTAVLIALIVIVVACLFIAAFLAIVSWLDGSGLVDDFMDYFDDKGEEWRERRMHNED